MAKINVTKIKEAEDAIRDLINWVEVWNLEEIQDGTKKIEDEVVEELKSKLEDLAKKIQYLWKNPELCKKMGKAGQEKVVSKYSQSIYYNNLIEVYQKAIKMVRN